MIAILILIVLGVVGISYGWTSIEGIYEGYLAFMQVIESDQFKDTSALGKELAQESIGFLEERAENYKANNP